MTFSQNRKVVKNQVQQTLTKYPSLQCGISMFVANDGTASNALVLRGTIPMMFQKNQYNIPIEVFLAEKFPSYQSPVVFVRPTADMMVPPNHPYVYPDGLVHVPYSDNWNGSSILKDLLDALVTVFSQRPPLYQKPPVTSNPQTTPSVYGRVIDPSKPTSTPTPTPTPIVKGSAVTTSNSQPQSRHQSLVNDVSTKLQQSLHEYYTEMGQKLDKELANGNKLQVSSNLANTKLADMQKLKISLLESISAIETKKKSLVEFNESSKDSVVATDDLVSPFDSISNQIVNLSAEARTIEDAIYFLNRSFQAGDNIDATVYIKEIRKLARQQFLLNIHLNKIMESVK